MWVVRLAFCRTGGRRLERHPSVSVEEQLILFPQKDSEEAINASIEIEGASDHMTRDSSQLKFVLLSPQSVISTANDSTSPITGEGSIILSNNLTLDNVLVVPSLEYNLLSVSQITSTFACTGENSCEENSGGAEFIELEAVNEFFNQPGCLDVQQDYAPNHEAESASLIAPKESSELPPTAPSTEESTKNIPLQDALTDPKWEKAMNKKMEALQKNATWNSFHSLKE
ncbi:uncharacterized protein [Aristolochia californica]|uniref:uncharacterized protein n=1 Tax=Aristolochia californica TaxID=171875 RepID=UPI0035DD28F0